jgi:hypothetical protein
MSRIKEPNYFSHSVIGPDHPMVRPIRSERRYLQLFSAAGDAKVIGEATPFYLEDPQAPALIDGTVPGAKIIVSLRDPVERLYSHYLMMRNNRPAMGGFMEEIERGLALEGDRNLAVLAPSTGLYSRQVERYRRVFGEDRFQVFILEEWSQDVPETLRRILAFVGIPHDIGHIPDLPQREYAEARGPIVRFLFGNRSISRATEALIPFRLRKLIRSAALVRRAPKPDMDPKARKFLIAYYRHDVRRLEQLLGRRLPWLNFDSQAAARRTASYRVRGRFA